MHARAEHSNPFDERYERIEEVLAVVEHHELMLFREHSYQRLFHRPLLLGLNVESGRDGFGE